MACPRSHPRSAKLVIPRVRQATIYVNWKSHGHNLYTTPPRYHYAFLFFFSLTFIPNRHHVTPFLHVFPSIYSQPRPDPRPYCYLGLILYHIFSIKIAKFVYYYISGILEYQRLNIVCRAECKFLS
ncbi:hypothetical protein BC826DRAFT_339933 [Russula brevipes]|nr:hypothetical protein BC826DRAFT_339933 [Russula brevipes]